MFQQVVGEMYARKICPQKFVISVHLYLSLVLLQVGNKFLQSLFGSCGSNKI